MDIPQGEEQYEDTPEADLMAKLAEIDDDTSDEALYVVKKKNDAWGCIILCGVNALFKMITILIPWWRTQFEIVFVLSPMIKTMGLFTTTASKGTYSWPTYWQGPCHIRGVIERDTYSCSTYFCNFYVQKCLGYQRFGICSIILGVFMCFAMVSDILCIILITKHTGKYLKNASVIQWLSMLLTGTVVCLWPILSYSLLSKINNFGTYPIPPLGFCTFFASICIILNFIAASILCKMMTRVWYLERGIDPDADDDSFSDSSIGDIPGDIMEDYGDPHDFSYGFAPAT